jgi:hypothetical protein
MRLILMAVVFAVGAFAFADEKKDDEKKHEYEPGKLPKVIKVKVGESIVVTHKINPNNVEEMTGKSDNTSVTVKGQTGNGVVQITIRSDKKGKAKVGWEIHQTNGKVDGRQELEVEFE